MVFGIKVGPLFVVEGSRKRCHCNNTAGHYQPFQVLQTSRIDFFGLYFKRIQEAVATKATHAARSLGGG
jgi:hypothetical protein